MRHRQTCSLLAFLLALGLAACYNRKDYTLTEPHLAAILTLQTAGGVTTLPADGVSRLMLVATIPADADPDKRDVVFSTSAGTLIGGSPGTNPGERVVSAAGNGQATIELASSTQVQAAVVTAKVNKVAGVVATLTVQFVPVVPDGTLRFVNPPAAPLPADGATSTPITVAVAPQLVNQQVSFTTTLGTIAPAAANVDTGGIATASLTSPTTIGTAQVTATVNGLSRRLAVEFSPALPQQVTLGVDNPVLTASATSKAVVTAQLLRIPGQVTPGAIASFSAADAKGGSVGFFTSSQVAAGAGGTAITQFFPGAGTPPGPVTLTVTTPGEGGGTLKSSIVIEIVAP